MFDIDTHRYFVSRDVEFFETEFPFSHKNEEGNDISMDSFTSSYLMADDGENEPRDPIDLEPTTNVEVEPNVRGGTRELENGHNNSENELGNDTSSHENSSPHELENGHNNSENVDHDGVEELGRGHRVKMPSVKLRDFVSHTVKKLSPSPSSPPSQHPSGAPYPLTHYVNCEKISMKHRRFVAALEIEREPVHFSEAVKDAKWRLAMQQELQALENNGT